MPPAPPARRPDPSAQQLAAVRHWATVTRVLGELATSVFVAVALENRSVIAWATARRLNPSVAMGVLFACLDRLAQFYDLAERPEPPAGYTSGVIR